MNETHASSIFDVFEINFFQAKILMTRKVVIHHLINEVFSRISVNVLELQPSFLFKNKGRPSQIISKVVVRKCSLKQLFRNISQISRKPSVVDYFCQVKIKKNIYSYGHFLENFLKVFRAVFLHFRETTSVERKIFQNQLSGSVF